MMVGAQGNPVTADDLLDTVGGEVTTHVVILIDTSGSMARDGLYSNVTAAVEGFVAALGPHDTASVIPFDEGPGSTCRVTPADPSLAGCVPAGPPAGAYTDIGRALAAAVADAAAQPEPGAVIVLVSDGDHDPAAGSPYPAPPSATAPGWRDLRADAGVLPEATAYALPLAGSTSVDTLDVVFPGARTLTASSRDEIQEELRSVTQPRRRATVERRLAEDARPAVTASWVGDGTVNGQSGQGTATLRLRSSAVLVPLTVTVTEVRAAGYPVQARALAPVTLAPGGTVDVTVPLTWRPPQAAGTWRSDATLSSALTVSAAVGTPWSSALRTLRIDVRPEFTAPPPLRLTSVRDLGWTGAAYTVVLLLAVPVLAALAIGLWRGRRAWRRRHPVPSGVLLARPLFDTSWSEPLPVGRLAAFRTPAGLPGTVVIRYRGVRRGDVWEPVYEVRYTPPVAPGEPARPDWSYCQPGGSVLVNGMLFAHRPERHDDDVAAPRHEHAVRQ